MSDKPITLGYAIDRWLTHPDNTQLAPSTQESKRRTLNGLVRIAGTADYLVDCLTLDHFDDTMRLMRDGVSQEENLQRKRLGKRPISGRGKRALESDRTALTMFAEYLRIQGWVEPTFYPLHRFTGTSKADEAESKIRPNIEDKDVIPLLEAAGKIHPRVRIAVAIGLFYGRRISEALSIQWKNVDIENATMSYEVVKRGKWVADKGFTQAMKVELELWWKYVEEQCGPIDPEWYLIPARMTPTALRARGYEAYEQARVNSALWPITPNRPATKKKVTDDIHRALRAIGWEDVHGQGMHTLRLTLARKYEELYGLGVAQEALDHERAETTQHYTRNQSGRRKYAKLMKHEDPFGVLPPEPEDTTGQDGQGGIPLMGEAGSTTEVPDNVIRLDQYRRKAS